MGNQIIQSIKTIAQSLVDNAVCLCGCFPFRVTKRCAHTLKNERADESLFPPIIKPGETYGLLKKEFLPKGLNKDIKVIACGSHDTASAVLGANGEGDFAYISSGTWSLIGTELQDPLMSEQCRLYNFTNEIGYNHTIRFLKNTMGMFIINEIRNDFKNKGIEISNKDIVPLVNMAKDVNATIDVNDPVFEKPTIKPNGICQP